MTQRFSRLFPTLVAPMENNCGSSPECKCCAAIRRARETALFDPLPEYCSPLTPDMQLVNISHDEDGHGLRVELGDDWRRMFHGLSLAGSGLVVTRNMAAILGRHMLYPLLGVTSDGNKGVCDESGLRLDFRQLGAARAIHARRETGHLFGVEFADHQGQVVHRFMLTPKSDLDEYFAWVRLHQACNADRSVMRIKEEREVLPTPFPKLLRHCGGDAFVSVLAECLDRAISLRVTVHSAVAAQRAEFTPRSLQPGDKWGFVSDDSTGLHFQPELFEQVRIEQPLRADGGISMVLRATVEGGATALVLEAGNHAARNVWHAVLDAMA
ncbi:MAG: hypothetical protein V4710_21635 [Verrucomicrobiota bacterium]